MTDERYIYMYSYDTTEKKKKKKKKKKKNSCAITFVSFPGLGDNITLIYTSAPAVKLFD